MYNKIYKEEHKEDIDVYNRLYNIENRQEIQELNVNDVKMIQHLICQRRPEPILQIL